LFHSISLNRCGPAEIRYAAASGNLVARLSNGYQLNDFC
jgi:hypothetical protein